MMMAMMIDDDDDDGDDDDDDDEDDDDERYQFLRKVSVLLRSLHGETTNNYAFFNL